MDTTMDHLPPSPLEMDTKPPTTSLPIARFPTTTGSSKQCTSGATATSTSTINSTIRKTSTTGSSPTGRRSSGWFGIRPVERQLMRPWLMEKLDAGIVKGLEWVDAAHTRFRIPWKHASRQGWRTEQDACLFKLWAQHTGRYRGDEAPNAKRWKANFRCALNSLPDAREVKTESQKKGQNAYRIYEFLNDRKPKVQHAHTSLNRSKYMTDGVKTEIGFLPSSPTDMQDVKYPATPNSCTASSPSGFGNQNDINNVRVCSTPPCGTPFGCAVSAPSQNTYIKEEPIDQSPYSHSPVSSPADSFCSTSSDDSPFSPPPADQHTPINTSRNWMFHLENDSMWVPQVGEINTNKNNTSYRHEVTATSSPSHAFPASPDHVTTSSTSFPATPVTSQSSMFNNGRSAPQMPQLTMNIGFSLDMDNDSGFGSPSSSGLGSPSSSGLGSPSSSGLGSPSSSGLGSPSSSGCWSPSSGLGSPSSSHSDMDYACSDDGSDVSVEISRNHIQEMQRECLKTSQDEQTFQQYHHYQQSQQCLHQQPPTHHHPPTSTHNYNNLYHMSAQNRHHLQHNTSLNHHNNQSDLQSNHLADDYSLVEALQNAFGTNIPEEMICLDPEEIESILNEEPYLNIDYKITVKTGSSMKSTIEANLTAEFHNYNGRT